MYNCSFFGEQNRAKILIELYYTKYREEITLELL